MMGDGGVAVYVCVCVCFILKGFGKKTINLTFV